VPRDLDLTPYRDEHDFDLLKRMQAARRRSERSEPELPRRPDGKYKPQMTA